MTPEVVMALMAETIKTTLLVAAPMLIVGLIIGVIISLFQAVTQIQEMTLVFVPKIVGVLITLVVALPWILGLLINFTNRLFTSIPLYVK
ncbi:MAG TPA: flagellar biosynthesis protein FliQ [Smithellaceae bacterium]|nr:flagellar biosynthesis protein FliQ [Smithellaceae bacterium]HOQ43139.1 flagellar biosynthesis protein FliQ [Smithellaceae bacterium]HQG79518.1 flagellar biosynthesis protein FliQ [Smithellaceae bacterium]